MAQAGQIPPPVLVIFGAGGDLTWRKLVPALYNLYIDDWLPEQLHILGLDLKPMDDSEFREHLRSGTGQFSRYAPDGLPDWPHFAEHLRYVEANFDSPAPYAQLAKELAAQDQAWNVPAQHIFYLAVPPQLIETIVSRLGEAGLVGDRRRARVVIEKPFGHDLESAARLNRLLLKCLAESQIFRIDHYLGKETVQNILALRFANSLFEPIWNRRYIDHVQLTVAEKVGVEHRGRYYDKAGALRDMVQNHLIRVLAHLAMEPPVSFEPDELRNKKLDVLRAIRPISRAELSRYAVRGQYGPGHSDGQPVPGYRQEPDVAPDSVTETFVALQLFIDNWRWQDVPFFIRTGKRLPARLSEACIQFKPVPHRSFPPEAVRLWEPNRLVVYITPEVGVRLRFLAKRPGPEMHLDPVFMRFSYNEFFRTPPPDAYETLLLDVMRGDASLFMRADQAETAWTVVQPILEGWAAERPKDFPNYAAGEWGPAAADELLAREGRCWLMPYETPVSSDERARP
jgi:glucose-6-phosphate 1-dehydrogenase